MDSSAQPENHDPPSESDGAPTLLDLSSCQLRDLSSVDLPSTIVEVDLTANRLTALDPRLSQLSNLKKLSLRQNLLNDDAVLPLSSWHSISALQELVLRDNQMKKIPDVTIFKMLLVFDVSFNEITSLSGLSKVSNTLKELYVSKNEVTKIEEIEHFHELQILELGSNRLRVMENLQNLSSLLELWLGRNRIRVIDLCGLKCIKKISLQSNRLTSMAGLEDCVALEELYLSHNGIAKMEGLSTLVNLRVLDVASNKLTEINDIANLTKLEDLWLNDNQITSLDSLAEGVAGFRENLTTIYLERNPCASSPNYMSRMREIFPKIEQVDSEMFA
ncbi:protein phosphatase 1 regulatory inhibitor subunit PPP1R7 homolog isoform X2 [Salvia miltiorrhiza]|uniref:protein phosphatase 1 regulatory inhibitor subunit PPP1R7 homolog isoform X2 n=1 Tax=Salvia miltiorrhiza TaxID=226208 RepID=UPI0025ACF683|nr:protein phosphatase 1 regulatory inhibitor subunit PPP1R7 homolog isoform X2 [Salvia miltiorrhiza]